MMFNPIGEICPLPTYRVPSGHGVQTNGLPADVWRIIFENLSLSKAEMLKLRKTCIQFNAILAGPLYQNVDWDYPLVMLCAGSTKASVRPSTQGSFGGCKVTALDYEHPLPTETDFQTAQAAVTKARSFKLYLAYLLHYASPSGAMSIGARRTAEERCRQLSLHLTNLNKFLDSKKIVMPTRAIQTVAIPYFSSIIPTYAPELSEKNVPSKDLLEAIPRKYFEQNPEALEILLSTKIDEATKRDVSETIIAHLSQNLSPKEREVIAAQELRKTSSQKTYAVAQHLFPAKQTFDFEAAAFEQELYGCDDILKLTPSVASVDQ